MEDLEFLQVYPSLKRMEKSVPQFIFIIWEFSCMSMTLDLAIDLISRPSITPDDQGCQEVIARRLQTLGFEIQHLRFGQVDNLWARCGHTAPLLVLAGHTDVVPVGPVEAWQFPPFTPTLHQGNLYGRGIADMKGGLAAMVTACERFLQANTQHKGSLAFLITSDEEGLAVDGTAKVVDYLQQQGQSIEWCLLGEPASVDKLGDQIKNGRRGSLTGILTILGRQGHAAYPHLADNPIHRFAPLLQELCQHTWDQGNAFFPPTTFQVVNVQAGTGADNVIPGQLEVIFNFRYNTEFTVADLQQAVIQRLKAHHLQYELSWRHSGHPFLTAQGQLLEAVRLVIKEVCGYETALSTGGGTSDGRFIAPTGAQVIELGLLNRTIHQVNECVNIEDLDKLSVLYERILERLLLE